MNIVVYCGASAGVDSTYMKEAKNLGKWIAKNNYRLVYGGGKVGLMGAVADEVLAHGGEVIGIIPSFLVDREISHPDLTQLDVVDSMSERKNRMIELGDCYIALPGGPGTLEEIAEVISWGRIGQNLNPSILYNVNGYYDHLEAFFNNMVENGFLDVEGRRAMLVTNSLLEIEDYIVNYEPPKIRTY